MAEAAVLETALKSGSCTARKQGGPPFALAARRMRRRDVYIICDCQRHALRERTLWRRSVRAARATAHFVRRGGVALLLGVPLAFGAMNAPSEAMDAVSMHIARMSHGDFAIFTTERVKKDFLAPRETQTPRTLTLDV